MKKQLYKTLAILMAFIVCCAQYIPVSATEPDETINEIETKVVDYIKVFYENKDLGVKKAIATTVTSTDISDYLLGKSEVQQYVTELYDTQKENYNVDVILLNSEENSTNVAFEFQVITTFNYVDADFDTTVSEELYVNYDCNSNRIIEFCTPENYYDIAVRPDEKLTENTIISKKFKSNSSIDDKKAQLIEEINNNYIIETTATEKSNMPTISKAAASYNNSACVTYARNNFNKAKPASGKSSVPYYDFSTIKNNYDCTNFVSHAILAGGAKIYDTGKSGISSTGWYFRSINNRSSSWSGVTNLYNFLTQNTKSNTVAGIGKTYELSGAYWGVGDILQLKFAGQSNYGHSTIITQKKKTTDKKRAYAYVTGRTSKTKYNNNQAADDMAPGGMKRTIKIYNRT